MWFDDLAEGCSWARLWSGYVRCGDSSGIRKVAEDCPAWPHLREFAEECRGSDLEGLNAVGARLLRVDDPPSIEGCGFEKLVRIEFFERACVDKLRLQIVSNCDDRSPLLPRIH